MSNKPFAIQDGIKFPDGSIQTTAYTSSDANVWVQTFVSEDGAPTDVVSIANSVEYDADGNVIALFSHFNDNDSSRYYSVGKYTTTGTKIWTARFADGFNTDGWGLAVAGNYIYVAGRTLTSDESGYAISTLTKLDGSDGTIEWSKVYDFGFTSNSAVVDVASDGNPVMVGYADNNTDNYVTTTKVDAADGDIIWSRSLNGQGDEDAYGMAVGPNGEVVAIGYMNQLGEGEGADTDDHMLVVKYASDGTIAWQKAILFDAGFDCRGADADIDSDGNIYVTGSYQYVSELAGTTSALSILKLDDSGIKQWSRRITGTCDTFGVSVVVGADDKLYLSGVTGFAGYTGGEPDINNGYTWVAAKYGFDGTVEWQRLIDRTDTWTFNGDLYSSDGGGSNLAVKDGYVVLGGGFGDPGSDPQATVVQVSATGDVFYTGPWAFTAASFSGVLNSSASDITVVDAEKTDADNASNISVVTVTPDFDISAFLIGTLYAGGDASNQLVNGAYSVTLNADGSITFPTKTTVDYANRTSYTTGPTLELAKDPTESSVVITGPAATFSEPYAKRLVIQGQPGWRGSNTGETGAEGGDVYIWAGYGGEGSNYTGDGGDVKLRGGHGGQSAGYVRIEAGEAVNANGEGGFVDINAGDATAWFGGAETSHGGNVEIRGGRGYAYGGNVNIHTASTTAHNQTWTFSHDGSLTLPAGGNLIIPNGLTISDNVIEGNVVATVGGQWTYATNADGGTDNQGSQGVNLAVTTETSAMLVSWQDNHTIPWTMQFYGEGTVEVVSITDYSSYIQVATSVATSHLLPVVVTSGNYQSGTPAEVVLKVDTKLWIFGTDGNLIIPATGDIIRDGTSIFASSTALPIVTITNANYNQFDQPVAPATETTDGAVSFTVTSPVALTATGLLLISGSNNKGGTIVAGSTSTGSQTLAFDMGGYSSTYTVMAFATTTNGTSYSAPVGGNGGYVCFPAGTMITLRNGDKKAIEYIGYSDDLLVWNFDLGVYASAKPIWIMAAETASEYNLLTFSNGFVLKTVGNHHIFNKQAERFTHTMTADTPIGTVSINEQGEEITLVSAEVVRETVEFYNVWTEYHLNMFAEGVLTSNRFNNTYPMISMKFVKGNKELRPLEEFNGIDPKWIHGLRLQEQTAEHTAEYIKWYVSERLEKLSIDSTEMVE